MSSTSTLDINDTLYDVIIVGAGNAGFSAASTASETLRSLNPSPTFIPKILLLEKASRETSGGNTFYTAGAYRFTFDSLSDLRPILSHDGKPGLPDDLASKIEMSPYTTSDFHADMDRLTTGRADPALADVLISQSRDAVNWIAGHGGQWELSFHRQAYEVDGKYKFWGGLVVCFAGGGKGLVKWHEGLAERLGVEVRYDTAVVDLVSTWSGTEARVTGVVTQCHSNGSDVRTTIMSRGGVILAAGGFQASRALRVQHLGPKWAAAHVRGSPTNTGDMHSLLIKDGNPHKATIPIASSTTPPPSSPPRLCAKSTPLSAGSHSVCWDSSSPRSGGSRTLTNQYTKSGYPLGIMVNTSGVRFVNEGADLRNYTYAKFGREVLRQPGGVAWQVWDARGTEMLRAEEYDASVTRLISARTLEGLADALVEDGMGDREAFLRTVRGYNEACDVFARERPEVGFDPAVRDGLSTQSEGVKLEVPKSNWARALSEPPFVAVKITCGVTFTFGGLNVLPGTAEVVVDDGGDGHGHGEQDGDFSSGFGEGDTEEKPIKGLYCCGELMGGLFWDNYPGGSGLTAGTVFGRIAGRHAAMRAVEGRKDDE